MSVTLTRTQSRALVEGPAYQVTDTCTVANSFDTAIYVFRLADDAFSQLASVRDMLTVPVGKAAAQTAKAGFYRLSSVTKSFATVLEAQAFVDQLAVKAQILCNEYRRVVDGFLGNGQPITIVTTGATGD